MPDNNLPLYDLILRCDRILPMEVKLPEGCCIRAAIPADMPALAALLAEAGLPAAEASQGFVALRGNALIGAILYESGAPRTLHHLVVASGERRQGVGRALVKTALRTLRREDNGAPVWLHLWPKNWEAALLFCAEGFRIRRRDTFGSHPNQFDCAMETLKTALPEKVFRTLEGATDTPVAVADISAIRYDDRGLVPAIAQDAATGEVLMQAYMNAESLRLTLESGYATYFSRSRQELWRKGATSGHLQRVIRLSYDCDADSILMQVDQTGPACHTGARSCFHHPVLEGELPATPAILDAIEQTVADRAANPRPGSYTNYLLDKGAEKICKKVGEEASETIIAAMKGDPDALAGEAADLLYHLAVLLYQQGVPLRDVWEVLRKRHT